MNELTVQTKIDENLLIEYLDTQGLTKTLQPYEKKQFLNIAQAYQLNPFKREIYCIAYGTGDYRTLSIITGYETYLKRAERTGNLKGWKCWTEGTVRTETKTVTKKGRNGDYDKSYTFPVGDLVAKIQIHKAGWEQPFEHEVYLEEYAQANEMWGQKPRTMLKKVCMGQGFRLAFPDELGGLPYMEEELGDEMRDVTHSVPTGTESVSMSTTVSLGVSDHSQGVSHSVQTEPENTWKTEWKERVMAMSKVVKDWPKPDRDALELGSLAKEAEQAEPLMELAEQRAAYYAAHKDSPHIDAVMTIIKSCGRDLTKLRLDMGEYASSLAVKAEPEPEPEGQLF